MMKNLRVLNRKSKNVLKVALIVSLWLLWVLSGLDLVLDSYKVALNSTSPYALIDEYNGVPVVEENDNGRYVYVSGERIKVIESYMEVSMKNKPGCIENVLVMPITYGIIVRRAFLFAVLSILLLVRMLLKHSKLSVSSLAFLVYVVYMTYVIVNVEVGYIGEDSRYWVMSFVVFLSLYFLSLLFKKVRKS